jgi:plastocyanin
MNGRESSTSWARLRPLLTGLVVVTMLAVLGCQARQQQATPEGQAPAAGASGTQPVTLTWDQQDSCVTFQPATIRLKVGERVQFNSSLSQSITLHLAAGAFGDADTVITVNQGANQTTNSAQTVGSYTIATSLKSCSSPSGDVSPSVIIEAGTP